MVKITQKLRNYALFFLILGIFAFILFFMLTTKAFISIILKTLHKSTNESMLITPQIARLINSGNTYESKLEINDANAEQGIIIKTILTSGLTMFNLIFAYFFIIIKFKTHVIT